MRHESMAMRRIIRANRLLIEQGHKGDTLGALQEMAELRRDAERYRWLRVQDWYDGPLAVVANPKAAIKPGHDAPSRERLDALIDAQVAEVQGFIDQTVTAVLSMPADKA